MIPIPLDGRWTRQKSLGFLALLLAAVSTSSALVARRELRIHEPLYRVEEPARYPDREAQFLQRPRARGNPEIVVGDVESLQDQAFHSQVAIRNQLRYQEQMLTFGRFTYGALAVGLFVIGGMLLLAPPSVGTENRHAA